MSSIALTMASSTGVNPAGTCWRRNGFGGRGEQCFQHRGNAGGRRRLVGAGRGITRARRGLGPYPAPRRLAPWIRWSAPTMPVSDPDEPEPEADASLTRVTGAAVSLVTSVEASGVGAGSSVGGMSVGDGCTSLVVGGDATSLVGPVSVGGVGSLVGAVFVIGPCDIVRRSRVRVGGRASASAED